MAENSSRVLSEFSNIRYITVTLGTDTSAMKRIGMENSIGDFVAIVDIVSDPPELIKKSLILINNSDLSAAVGISKVRRHSIFIRFLYPVAEFFLSRVDYRFPVHTTEYRMLSRRVVNALTKKSSGSGSIDIDMSKLGVIMESIDYDLSIGYKKKSFLTLFRKFMEILIFNSLKPLRWVSMLGLTGSAVSLVVALYSLVSKLLKNNIADGWTSLVVLISLNAIFVFTILAFSAEYLARILRKSDEEQGYIIEEKNSIKMINDNRVNIHNK